MSARIQASVLQRIRTARGFTQTELAQRSGVTRQLIGAIEAGRQVPNVAAALALADALDTTVEALFRPQPKAPITLDGQALAAGIPVNCARVGDQLIAIPLTVPDASGWGLTTTITTKDGVEKLLSASQPELLIAGCDPILGTISELLAGTGHQLLSASASTGRAIRALAAGRAHGVVVHAPAGELPTPSVPVRRWQLTNWQVGLAGIATPPSLDQLASRAEQVVQRDSDAGAQKALERALQSIGARPGLPGPIASGHIDAARRVAYGIGSAGLVMEAAARHFELAFTPLEHHRVELWLAEEWLDLPASQALVGILTSTSLRTQLQLIPGYDHHQTGTEIK